MFVHVYVHLCTHVYVYTYVYACTRQRICVDVYCNIVLSHTHWFIVHNTQISRDASRLSEGDEEVQFLMAEVSIANRVLCSTGIVSLRDH